MQKAEDELTDGCVSFVRRARGNDPYTAAHEVGHILTDKMIVMPPDTISDHYLNDMNPKSKSPMEANLMYGSNKDPRMLHVKRPPPTAPWQQSKRLWNHGDLNGHQQIDKIMNNKRFI